MTRRGDTACNRSKESAPRIEQLAKERFEGAGDAGGIVGGDRCRAWLGGGTLRCTGNSFAAPHVAGIAALVLAKHPELTPYQVKTVLRLTATNTEATMANRDTLLSQMQLPESTIQHINERGIAVADLDTMSQAVHDVYCGIMADHQHPNEKDRDQAAKLLAALSG